MPLKDGTESAEERDARERAVYDAMPTITRCAVEGCTWSFEGRAGDGREMFLAHRRLRHGFGMDDAGPEPTQEAIETSGDPDLDQIRDILGHGQEVEIRLPYEPQPWRREWIESLGGRIVIDPEAPMPLAFKRDNEEDSMNVDQGRSALDAMDAGEPQQPERSAMANGQKPRGYWTRERVIESIKRFAEQHGRPPKQNELTAENDLPSVSRLTQMFGSQSKAIEAAGFEAPKRGEPRKPRRAPQREPEHEPEPAPLPVPAAPPEPPALGPVAADPEKVDVFELFETMATEERIEFYERQAAAAQAKAEALKQIREALDGVKEPA